MGKSKESEEQNARFLLRERYLYLLSSLCQSKKEVNFTMFENTNVSAKIQAADLEFENIVVENLKTPLQQTLPYAILRTSDIISMSFDKDDTLLKLNK